MSHRLATAEQVRTEVHARIVLIHFHHGCDD